MFSEPSLAHPAEIGRVSAMGQPHSGDDDDRDRHDDDGENEQHRFSLLSGPRSRVPSAFHDHDTRQAECLCACAQASGNGFAAICFEPGAASHVGWPLRGFTCALRYSAIQRGSLADQQQREIPPGWQPWSAVVRIEALAQALDVPIEVVLLKNLIQAHIEGCAALRGGSWINTHIEPCSACRFL
jgi:hypothetical protein